MATLAKQFEKGGSSNVPLSDHLGQLVVILGFWSREREFDRMWPSRIMVRFVSLWRVLGGCPFNALKAKLSVGDLRTAKTWDRRCSGIANPKEVCKSDTGDQKKA